MAFIETKITPEMIAKYDMQQDYSIVENYHIRHMYSYGQELTLGIMKSGCSNLKLRDSSELIIDEEQDCYLRYAGSNMFAKVSYVHRYYLLYYQGQRMYFVTHTDTLERDEIKKFASSITTILQINSLQPISITSHLCDTIAIVLKAHYKYRNVNNWRENKTFNFEPIL